MIQKGEWESIMKLSRELFELLHFKNKSNLDQKIKSELEKHYEDRHGTKVGFNELYEGITKLFHHASKFIHEKEESGRNFNIKPTGKIEDAYFVYALSINTLNLILTKLKT